MRGRKDTRVPDHSFGAIAQERGYIHQADLMAAVVASQGKRIGETLVELGRMSHTQVVEVLRLQTERRRAGTAHATASVRHQQGVLRKLVHDLNKVGTQR